MEMNSFDWVPFYKEFALKLLDYKNNRNQLINKIIKLYEDIEINLPTLEKKGQDIIDIDPFTIFGLFNKGIRIDNRIKILKEIKIQFQINADIPTGFDSIPILNNQNATFYHFVGERSDNDIDNLWLFFQASLNYASNQSSENKEILGKYFDIVRDIKGIADSKLTMSIYWIAPDFYLNLDKRNTWYIYESGKIPKDIVVSLPKLNGKLTSVVYFEILDKIKNYVYSSDSNFKDFKELSFKAWIYSEEVNKEIKSNTLDNNGDMNKLSKASFIKWFKPIISALKTLNGWGTPTAVRDQIIFDMNLSEEVINETRGKTNVNKFVNETAFARNYLAYEGIIISEKRGIWTLSKKGYEVEMTDEYATQICKRWASTNQESKSKLEKDDSSSNNENAQYSELEFLKEVYISQEKYRLLVDTLIHKKNIILQGAPGVGKTFIAKRLAYSIMEEKDDTRIKLVQFHQSYSYEDFVMGFRPTEAGFELMTGAFYDFCIKAEQDSKNDYFFIIDEINRGNLSKIFGELFMLIEKEHRGSYLGLVYSNESFAVPDNLYIIGMMNTADRSLAMLDYALRRRFAFFDLEPGFQTDGFIEHKNKINHAKFDKLISFIEKLNDEIVNDVSLGEGFQIGHSFFCFDIKDYDYDKTLNLIVEYEIIPLIKEYWFDDHHKVLEWSNNLRGAIK